MRAQLLDGRAIARDVIADLRPRIDALGRPPRLVFVRVGEDPASASYVRSKARLAERAGVRHATHVFPSTVTVDEVLDVVQDANIDDDVDGILVQLPLPTTWDPAVVIDAIDPAKDVDGLHPVNVGALWSARPSLAPATPAGLLEMLDRTGVALSGMHVVIVGRSNLVGKPAAALFLQRDATVTLAHSRTRNLDAVTRTADVLVAAVGRPGLVTGAMVKRGAIVLDVGQAPVDGTLRGDVDASVLEVASTCTPTPGGTGPMTVAMVVANTVLAAERRRGAARGKP